MRGRLPVFVVLLVLFVILGGLSFAVNLYFDYLWFSELGKTEIFTTILYAKSSVGSLVLLVSFVFVYLNLIYADRSPGLIQIGIPTPTGQITAYTVPPGVVGKIAALAAVAVGLLLAMREGENWEIVWRWLKRVPFGVQDPVFSRDISFYFFSLPLFQEIVSLSLILAFLTLIGTAVLYYLKGALTLRHLQLAGGRGRAAMHVSVLAALIFVFLAWDAYLDRFQLLFGQHDVFSGANYTDLHGRIPMLNVLVVAAILGAVLWLYNAFVGNNRIALGAVGLYVVVLVAGGVYPALLQKFIVAPSELDRELPQIQHNIQATLKAYNLDKVEDRSLSGDKALTPADIEANAATIRNIRLWDHEPLLDALKQIQEIRTYYDFASVDNDRYSLGSELQQIMISGRELNSNNLPERNWINEHLSYTHGYGIALGPVNQITSEGLPVLFVKDLPPSTLTPVFAIKRPEIYYGELTSGYAIVNTGQKEFDFPSGESNVYASYSGTGGVPVDNIFRKLLFAFYFKDANILLSPLVVPESRFLYFRDLNRRFSRVAPFLKLDRDPYVVISEGRLFWIQDAYTTGDHYPYATATRGVGNYIRNSAKLVLDAYNGTVDLYVSDPSDPLIQVYQRIFPGTFKSLAEIPGDMRKHLRYPEDIFRVQTYMYSVYHMGDPQVFYNKEDLWEIPDISTGGSENPMAPYYTIMRLPTEKQEEFILMLPFTPGRKDNLSAWMVARSDAQHYGQLVVYRFPKQKLVYGPKQIVARINQDAEISRQVSLWDQRGSQVIQGALLVIPIEEALIYVRPLYLRSESGRIPELKRVIVAYENKIVMEETLEASIARIFQGETAQASATPPTSGVNQAQTAPAVPRSANLLQQASEAYDRAVTAQRSGDWARYGEELRRLGSILQELSRATPGNTPAK